MHLISPLYPFPSISWWMYVLQHQAVCFDTTSPFAKMSYRNRYDIAGGNGLLRLSIPISGGRNQKEPMNTIRISNTDAWQRKHWRTLVSCYNRSPYFSHYASELEHLFNTRFEWLVHFNRASIEWLARQCGLSLHEMPEPPDRATAIDLRYVQYSNPEIFPRYYQVFEERHGFLPDLSLLDLLCCQGPYTGTWLRENRRTPASLL